MNDPNQPTVGRIIEVDYGASISLLAPVAFWGLTALMIVFGAQPLPWQPGGISFLFVLALAVTVIGGLGLALRVRAIRALFAGGMALPGKVEGVGFFRDRGRVEFSYIYNGEALVAGSPLMKGKRTEALRKGQPVTVVVDPANPRRAMIKELFT
jgi:hypothetical protein